MGAARSSMSRSAGEISQAWNRFLAGWVVYVVGSCMTGGACSATSGLASNLL